MVAVGDQTRTVVNISANGTLLAAAIVFVIWRLLVWRRHGVRPLREIVVVLLFLYCLVLVSVTFFPMRIVLYDWYGSANLIPLASITQLIRETAPQTAIDNIAGNVVLFMPFGFLLPVLYSKAATFGGIAWRAAVVSVAIELLQVFTRARATDVDDIILNTAGALIGFAVFRLLAWITGRRGATLLDRIRSDRESEPLRDARWPVGLSLLAAVPMVAIPFVQSTIGEGADGILADAVQRAEGGTVVHRGEVENHTFVLVEEGEMISVVEYEEVFPGRFTWVGGAAPIESSGSIYSWSLPAINPSVGEDPLVVLFGRNDVGALSVEVVGNGIDVILDLPDSRFFVVGSPFPFESAADVIDDFEFEFRASDGRLVTEEFRSAR